MNLSKHFESNDHHHLMDTHSIVGSTTASGDDSNNNHFQQRSNANSTTPSYEGTYQVDVSSTTFELESITSSYTGLMLIYRLLYVADHCPSLRNEALLASLKYIQETHFTTLYKQVNLHDPSLGFFAHRLCTLPLDSRGDQEAEYSLAERLRFGLVRTNTTELRAQARKIRYRFEEFPHELNQRFHTSRPRRSRRSLLGCR